MSGRVGLARMLAAEWTKLVGVRSTAWIGLVLVAVVPALAGFVALTGSLRPEDTVAGASLTGAVLGQLAAGVLGALVVSGEYGTGLIRTTLTACPRRRTVLAAKALVVVAVTAPLALAGCAVAYGVGTVLLRGDARPTGAAVPAVVGVPLAVAGTAVLGIALGTVLRHSAGAVTAVLAVVLLPVLLAPLSGDLRGWVAGAGPAAAVQKLAGSTDAAPEVAGSLGGWPSLALLTAYAAGALALAGLALTRRDA